MALVRPTRAKVYATEIGRPRRAAYLEWGNGPHWPPATARESRQRLQPPPSYAAGYTGLPTFS